MRKVKITYDYRMPEHLGDDPAANMAMFLVVNGGSCFERWYGRMHAPDQRRLFGKFLGKGKLCIRGDIEELSHARKVCFGTDVDVDKIIAWRDLPILPKQA